MHFTNQHGNHYQNMKVDNIKKKLLDREAEKQIKVYEDFLLENIPTWQQKLLNLSPIFKTIFNYQLKSYPENKRMELWKNGRIVAKNY